MRLTRRDTELEAELVGLVGGRFHGMTVEAGYAARWKRNGLLFRWPGFAGLLPEERFHRLCQVIPEKFRETRLAGMVWVELAPGESVEAFLELPRSEDIVPGEGAIYGDMKRAGVVEALAKALGRSAEKNCESDFSRLEAVLQEKKFTAERIRDVKLACIRHHAYCDCQVVQTAAPALAKLYSRLA